MIININKENEVDLRTKEQKKFDRQMAVRRKWDAFAGFIRSNMDVLVVTVPAAITVVNCGSKLASKAIQNRTVTKELKAEERRIYDHSLGRYTYLKRPMSAKEALIYEDRRARGEKVNTILEDMKLLKK